MIFNKNLGNIIISSTPGLISIFLSFFTIPIYLKYLGLEKYGLYAWQLKSATPTTLVQAWGAKVIECLLVLRSGSLKSATLQYFSKTGP